MSEHTNIQMLSCPLTHIYLKRKQGSRVVAFYTDCLPARTNPLTPFPTYEALICRYAEYDRFSIRVLVCSRVLDIQ